MNVLIVDDSDAIRMYLYNALLGWKYNVFQAANGKEALDLIIANKIQILIVDWMMPEMDGLELCKQVRNTQLGHYVYLIMLTSRESETVTGLSAGADDFMAKPIKLNELQARMRSAERVLSLDNDHAKKHGTLQNEHEKMVSSYQKVQEELAAATKIQQNMLPKSKETALPITVDWYFSPASDVSGDFFNYFVDEQYVYFYHIDIAGHGISAAMYAIYLNRLLSPNKQSDIALGNQRDSEFYSKPSVVANALNQELCQQDGDCSSYLTMIYGVIDRKTGLTEICRAGHPYPFLSRKDTKMSFLQDGNLPVGLLDNVNYQSQTFQMSSGDRLIMYSDGIIDCLNSQNEQYSIERFGRLLMNSTTWSDDDLMNNFESEVNQWKGSQEITDDISIFSITYN